MDGASHWGDPHHVHEYLKRELPHRADAEALLLEALPDRVERFVDLGTGDGRMIELVRRRFPAASALGLDASTPMLEQATARFGDDPGIELRRHDLNEPLPTGPPLDAVVSGFAVHHVENERKRTLFPEIFDRLRPGGVFANLELVAPSTPEMHRRFREALGKKDDDPSDRLAPLGDQLAWLEQCGFEAVDCHFKWLELALIVARRPAA